MIVEAEIQVTTFNTINNCAFDAHWTKHLNVTLPHVKLGVPRILSQQRPMTSTNLSNGPLHGGSTFLKGHPCGNAQPNQRNNTNNSNISYFPFNAMFPKADVPVVRKLSADW